MTGEARYPPKLRLEVGLIYLLYPVCLTGRIGNSTAHRSSQRDPSNKMNQTDQLNKYGILGLFQSRIRALVSLHPWRLP